LCAAGGIESLETQRNNVMERAMIRATFAVAAAIAMVGLAAAPASAATENIQITGPSPGVVNVTLGDTVTLTNSLVDGSQITVFGNSTICGGGVSYGPQNPGDVVTLGTFDTPAWHVGDIEHFTMLTDGVFCTSFDLQIVAATPPPDVAEAPYVGGLLGAAAVVFGLGFFLMRRRRHRLV
jgi:hypothetical protein